MHFLLKIGQGTGYDLYEKKLSKKGVSYILDKGIELGLNLIDTAENYFDGEIETIVGKVIRKKRDKVVISTKFSPQNSRYSKVINSCNASLKRLKTDYIDIYQVHWPNPNIDQGETFKALVDLKRSGKIKEIGVGNYTPKLLSRTKKFLKNERLFSFQSEFNIFERTIEQNGVLDFCNKNRIRIIAYSPLDQGRLEAMDESQKSTLKKISEIYGLTISQIILSWIISKKIIPIPMTLNLNHLKQNAKCLTTSISKKHAMQIDKVFHIPISHISPKSIRVLPRGERNSFAYTTIKEALNNKFNLSPSPKELAIEIKKNGLLKPVRLIRSKSQLDKKRYDLISGRVRYWGWIIAYGDDKPIPSYLRENLKIA